MAQAGDPLYFEATLGDRATDKFVRAIVRADGIIIWPALNIPHSANGTYILRDPNTYVFPDNTFEVTITYDVFSDAGFTSRIKKYKPGKDTYRISPAPDASEVIDGLEEFLNNNRLVDIDLLIESEDDMAQIMLEVNETEEITVSVGSEDLDESVMLDIQEEDEIEILVELNDN